MEQRGGRHRSSLGWQPLGTSDRTAPSPREAPQDGRELSAARQSLGLEAGLAGPREGQGPAEVMGSDGTRVAMSWASPPVAQGGRGDTSGTLPPALLGGRAGQAVLGAGHAEALQGMGSWVLPILRSRGRARPGPGQVFPVLTWLPKAQQLPRLLWKCPLQTHGLLSVEVLDSRAQAVTHR